MHSIFLPAHGLSVLAKDLPLHIDTVLANEAMSTITAIYTALAAAFAVMLGSCTVGLVCHYVARLCEV